jgi:hypothetical protein
MAGITYRDEIVIYRVITSDEQEARRFLSALKERLKEAFQQEDILIVDQPSPPRSSVVDRAREQPCQALSHRQRPDPSMERGCP